MPIIQVNLIEGRQPLSHDEVIEVAALATEKFIKLIKETNARM